jgi:predicted nucleic acid-binding protein
MIVLDTSIFIDLLFEYNSERTRSAEELLSILEENGLTIVEPDLFKVEFTGQIARRIKKDRPQRSARRSLQSWSSLTHPGSSKRHFPSPGKQDQGRQIHST